MTCCFGWYMEYCAATRVIQGKQNERSGKERMVNFRRGGGRKGGKGRGKGERVEGLKVKETGRLDWPILTSTLRPRRA